MLTLYQIAFAPTQKSYRIGLLFTHKNGDFGAISVTGRSCPVPISKVKRHILDGFYATLWCSVNRLPSLFTLCRIAFRVDTRRHPAQCERSSYLPSCCVRRFAHPVDCCCVLLGVVASVCTSLKHQTQQHATLLAKSSFSLVLAHNSQHCWMLHVASVCTPWCKLLHPFSHPRNTRRNNKQHCWRNN